MYGAGSIFTYTLKYIKFQLLNYHYPMFLFTL